MSVDSIGDFLTVIRNGIRVTKQFVVVPFSTLKFEIAKILEDEGFVRHADLLDQDGKKFIKISLKYVQGESAIHEITRISKLGRRYYTKAQNIKPVIGGLGLSILTTNQGVVSHKQAQKLGIGGEVICTVW